MNLFLDSLTIRMFEVKLSVLSTLKRVGSIVFEMNFVFIHWISIPSDIMSRPDLTALMGERHYHLFVYSNFEDRIQWGCVILHLVYNYTLPFLISHDTS